MVQVAKRWGLVLSTGEALAAVQGCPCCAQAHPCRYGLQGKKGRVLRGGAPVQHWQVEFIRPLPPDQASSPPPPWLWTLPPASSSLSLQGRPPDGQLSEAWNTWKPPMGHLNVASDNETRFTGKEVQSCTKAQDIAWQFHVPYHPQAAGMFEWYKGLLKDKLHLGVDPPSVKD